MKAHPLHGGCHDDRIRFKITFYINNIPTDRSMETCIITGSVGILFLGYSIYSSLSEPSDVADEESAAGIAALRSSILDLILDASSPDAGVGW